MFIFVCCLRRCRLCRHPPVELVATVGLVAPVGLVLVPVLVLVLVLVPVPVPVLVLVQVPILSLFCPCSV